VATAASRCAQLVGMTACMFRLNEAATIPCRAHHTASQSWVILPRVPQVEILTGGKKQSVPADGSPMYPPHETSNPPPACWQHHYQDICGEHFGAVREPQRHVIGSRLERSYAVQPHHVSDFVGRSNGRARPALLMFTLEVANRVNTTESRIHHPCQLRASCSPR
jgi:hypothetical protein